MAATGYGGLSVRNVKKIDPMNQTFGDMSKLAKEPMNSTVVDNFKFPQRAQNDKKSSTLATKKSARETEKLFLENQNKESKYDLYYQARFKRSQQHKVMVKKEQKMNRKKLAAQNKDM